METNKKRLAQDIDIDNNIIPEDNNNTDKDIKKEETPTPVIEITEEEIKPIEEISQPIIEPVIETPQPAVKNTVKYIDSGFTF